MSLLFDILLIVIFLLCIYTGVKKGFVHSVMSFVTFIAAFLSAWKLSPGLAVFYRENIFDEKLTRTVSDAIGTILHNGLGTLGLENLFADKPQAFMDIVNRYHSSITELENYYNMQVASGSAALEKRVSEYIALPVSEILSSALAFLTIFAVVTLVLSLISALLDAVFKLPVLNALNRIMGFLLGAVCGILNVWAVSLVIKALVPVLGALFPQLFRAELFENSMLFNLIYEFNPFVYLGMDWLGL